MVRGNWQRRVELNESRRNEAKQRKLRNVEKKAYKLQANQLLSALECNNDIIWQFRPWEIHIWVDTVPSDDVGHTEDEWNEKETKPSRRKDRSASIESDSPTKSSSGRPPKKKHPNSKKPIEDKTTEVWTAPLLCCSQFYSGECKNRKLGRKGGHSSGCTLNHYNTKTSKTLHAVLKTKEGGPESQEILELSKSALPDVHQEDEIVSTGDSRGMDMIYNVSISSPSQHDEIETSSISDYITGILTKKSCSIGSIVYLAFNGSLLFDRYREGLIVQDLDLRECLSRGKLFNNSSSQSSSHKWNELPGSVLEYVLTFLSEREIATMSSVCRLWNNEIGKNSANLWKHFLLQRKWPYFDYDCSENTQQIPLRRAFLSHYSAVRDMKAIRDGIVEILTKKANVTKDAFSKTFDSLKDAPREGDACVATDIWSPNQVLCAYSESCRLHLFTTEERAKGEKVVRELVNRSVDPYIHTKKQSCCLVDLAIDDDHIGCLGQVSSDASDYPYTKNFILIHLTRDDFLLSDTSEALQVIDINQAILNFLLDYDGVEDYDQIQFLSYLSTGYDLDEFEVNISRSITSVGNGLFMLHASLGLNSEESILFQKFFLFSAPADAIVMMSDVTLQTTNLHHENMTLSSSVTRDERGSYHGKFSCASSVSTTLMPNGSFDSSAILQNPLPIQNTNLALRDVLQEGYSLCQKDQRQLTQFGHQLIVADSVTREADTGKEYKSFLSFFHQDKGYEHIQLDGNFQVLSLVPIRHDHILVLGAIRSQHSSVGDAVGGDWFGLTNPSISLHGYVYHVRSMTEIYRDCFVNSLETYIENPEGFFANKDSPLRIAADGGTVVAVISDKGIVLSGEDARSLKENLVKDTFNNGKSKKEKKKKKTPKKGGKKDGFARGMSLRG